MLNLSSNFQGKSKGKQEEKRWRLFHAKDFQSLMYPCFMFCRILGIFPYKINASTFEASKPLYILSIVVTCISIICSLIALLASSSFEEINILYLPWTLVNNCTFIFGGFVIIITFILSGPRMRLLQVILKISSRLPPEAYQKLSRLIHAKDIIGFLCSIWPLLIYIYTLQIFLIFQMYINLVVFQMSMLYMNCVCILKICFKTINDNLAHMGELVANDDPYVSRLIYHEQKYLFLIMELKTLKKQHLTISETVQMLNMIFSLQLLATVVINFFDITIHLFYYIFQWQHNILLNTSNYTVFNVYFLLYIMYLFLKIILIIWACETSKDQAQQISTSIYDVYNNTNNKQIKNELKIFSLQILHCENTFSAKALTMNAKFFTVMVGSIATYILILFQFISYSCEKITINNITEVNSLEDT